MNYSKDGITVAPCIDTSHPKKGGRFPVKIRVTYKRARQYYPTGKALRPEEWESMPTSKDRNMVSVRKDIENSYNVVRDTVEELAGLGTFSPFPRWRARRAATARQSSIGAARICW